jgi:F-type H+-transporting ATPase subunit a
MVERVPLGTIAFPLLLSFGPFLGLPYWACLVLWAYALESVLVCLGHRYSPLAKAALEWVTFGPKNLQFYWGNPGTSASRGVLVFTFWYGLYKAEMYQYNTNREKALQWATANARTSAEAAVKALPEGASADMVSNTFNSVSRETLNTIMGQWDMSNNPFPRWRRVLGLETPSAEFSLDVDSQGNYTVKGSAKPRDNVGFAAGGEIGKKRYPPGRNGESAFLSYTLATGRRKLFLKLSLGPVVPMEVVLPLPLFGRRWRVFSLPVSTVSMHFFFSPLDQFTIITLVPLNLGQFYWSFTNSALFMVVGTGLFVTLCSMVLVEGGRLVPTPWQSFVEMVYEFVQSLVKEQVGVKGKPYFPFFFTLFTFLLCNNLIGMVPYSFTTTSHVVVTFGLSVSVFVGVTVIGFLTHGLHFFSFLLPPGAPLVLAPFLVVIELVSYMFRAISLGVRLFANMMAGHTLVKILSGFGWSMLSLGGVLKLAALVPLVVVFALMFLEVGVAILQAYVFTILSCIYLNDAIALH